MSKYRSLENTIRFGPINELSKTHNPKHGKKEKDMNDQVYAGSYRSQHFEVSPDAQRIYSDISKDISGDKVERSVKTQDQLFGIMKKVIASGYSTQQDIDAAEQLAKKIYDVTNDFEVKIDHSHVDKMLNDIKSKYKDTPQVVDSNQFVGDIYIKPTRSINYIQLNFVAVGTGVDFTTLVGAV